MAKFYFFNRLKVLSRRDKQVILIIGDLIFLPVFLWMALSFRTGNIFPIQEIREDWWIFVVIPLTSIPLFIHFGLYRAVLKYMGVQVILASMKSVTISTLLVGFGMMVLREGSFPRSVIFIFWFISILSIIGMRYFAKWLLYSFANNYHSLIHVGIYGGGVAGAQLVQGLKQSNEFLPVAFFDDSQSKHHTFIHNIEVYSTEELKNIIKTKEIKVIILAMPSVERRRIKEILTLLKDFSVKVKSLPSIENILDGKVNIEDIREIDIDEILGRDVVVPEKSLLKKNISSRNVVVTGAGGSIGSELCRQIIELKPTRLILFERSEFALYQIHQELLGNENGVEVIPVLGSVTNEKKQTELFTTQKVHTIFHAAAYKHVPLVEINPIEGVKNNVLGTYYSAIAAMKANVNTFVLVSTDKAVRSTNVMGASKRLAELVLQSLAEIQSKTCFTMVRFGNVLNSTGSVVPLFRKQIKNGGPLTVTHPEVTRYFMSIPEAVQLIIQASTMARGGDVFVLDMGEPIKILDLATKLIYLYGFTPVSSEYPNGDIEIKFTGLRSGEKLYEELILGNNVSETEHPQIMRAEEAKLSWDVIQDTISQIHKTVNNLDVTKIRELLVKIVDGYNIHKNR
ncbi:MAG: polysaccharide biosynthesis protein [Candidatus Marinimicrobia bacterium]|nr:polysaccharide biosynthesis protein [Candidatus Neomarinimicrobiota bacterium]MBL7109961.1 polysaccharide biosynthesis protein [Candidatus Neomarinimicrobiota bacterium]